MSHRRPHAPSRIDWVAVGEYALIAAAAAVVLLTYAAYVATAAY